MAMMSCNLLHLRRTVKGILVAETQRTVWPNSGRFQWGGGGRIGGQLGHKRSGESALLLGAHISAKPGGGALFAENDDSVVGKKSQLSSACVAVVGGNRLGYSTCRFWGGGRGCCSCWVVQRPGHLRSVGGGGTIQSKTGGILSKRHWIAGSTTCLHFSDRLFGGRGGRGGGGRRRGLHQRVLSHWDGRHSGDESTAAATPLHTANAALVDGDVAHRTEVALVPGAAEDLAAAGAVRGHRHRWHGKLVISSLQVLWTDVLLSPFHRL